MSTPDIPNKATICDAICEIISGMSALHCPPEKLENVPKGRNFLTDTDGMVKHSLEHFRAAIKILRQYKRENNK